MADGLVIAIDGMGGDHAPLIVLDGVEAAALAHPDVRFQIHGPAAQIEPLLELRPNAKARAEVVHAERVIPMDAKPSQAMRQGKGSSIWSAVAAVETGTANAVVSAGNTGALMAIAMLRLRLTPGIARPALVASFPTMRGPCVLLDVGANVTADSEQLAEFAIMGEAFHRAVHGRARPSVGLLNVGAEDQKGHEEIRGAAKLLRDSKIEMTFVGFVEGDDIVKGDTDVIVTDGFTGNVALKTAEGVARLVTYFLKDALKSGPFALTGALLASNALRKVKARLDPRESNGAVFLGVNGLVVKSHGGTDGLGFAAAIDVAVRMARSHFQEEVRRNLDRVAPQIELAATNDAAAVQAREPT